MQQSELPQQKDFEYKCWLFWMNFIALWEELTAITINRNDQTRLYNGTLQWSKGVINKHHNEQTRSPFYTNVCFIWTSQKGSKLHVEVHTKELKQILYSDQDFTHELWNETMFTIFTLEVPKLWWHICLVCYSQRGSERKTLGECLCAG